MRALGFKISRESIEDMIGKHNTLESLNKTKTNMR